jgi:DNA-damage-inducible protein D
MATELSRPGKSLFEEIRQTDNEGNEFWQARQLAKALEYTDFRNFTAVVNKAKEACANSGQPVENHIVEFNEMVPIGSGATREMESYKLSRYACYLIVQNADPSKEAVALGQTYFAVQTRIQEIQQMEAYNRLSTEEEKRLFLRNEMAKHNTQLAAAAKNAGVITSLDYAIFQNHGYMGLYGGLDAKAIQRRKGLKKSQQILDHMGSTELAANLFWATQTEEKLRRENIQGKHKANQTHYEVGKKVRKTIEELGGTMPENLPPAESIKKVEKKKEEPKLKVPKKQKGK